MAKFKKHISKLTSNHKLSKTLNNKIKKNGNKKLNKTDKLAKSSSNEENLIHKIKKKPSKSDLKQVIEILKKEPKSIEVRKALKYIPHYLKSEGLTKKLLKEIILLWAESGEKVRVVCLLCLVRVYVKKSELRPLIIKKLYNTFLEKCRVTKEDTMSMIKFMRHSMVELYKLDTEIAFKQAQLSLQQLKSTLKSANVNKSQDSYRNVLNWQYANCLILLSSLVNDLMISSSYDDKSIRPIAQEVIELNLSSIELINSPRYYPYYLHLIDNLIGISNASGKYIPVMTLLIGIINRIQLVPQDKKSKKSVKNQHAAKEQKKAEHDNSEEPDLQKKEKTYDMDILNHVKMEECQSKNYKLAVLDKIHDLMLRYLVNPSHRIAFPELVLLPSTQLRKWMKKNPSEENHKFKNLLSKIDTDRETIETMRKTVDFEFKNFAAVDAWEKKLKDSNKMVLPKFLDKQ